MGWSRALVAAGLVGCAMSAAIPEKTADFPDMQVNELRSGSNMNMNSLHEKGKVLLIFHGDPS